MQNSLRTRSTTASPQVSEVIAERAPEFCISLMAVIAVDIKITFPLLTDLLWTP